MEGWDAEGWVPRCAISSTTRQSAVDAGIRQRTCFRASWATFRRAGCRSSCQTAHHLGPPRDPTGPTTRHLFQDAPPVSRRATSFTTRHLSHAAPERCRRRNTAAPAFSRLMSRLTAGSPAWCSDSPCWAGTSSGSICWPTRRCSPGSASTTWVRWASGLAGRFGAGDTVPRRGIGSATGTRFHDADTVRRRGHGSTTRNRFGDADTVPRRGIGSATRESTVEAVIPCAPAFLRNAENHAQRAGA